MLEVALSGTFHLRERKRQKVGETPWGGNLPFVLINNIIKVIRLRSTEWMGHVARMG